MISGFQNFAAPPLQPSAHCELSFSLIAPAILSIISWLGSAEYFSSRNVSNILNVKLGCLHPVACII
jgi:hypothetical protein